MRIANAIRICVKSKLHHSPAVSSSTTNQTAAGFWAVHSISTRSWYGVISQRNLDSFFPASTTPGGVDIYVSAPHKHTQATSQSVITANLGLEEGSSKTARNKAVSMSRDPDIYWDFSVYPALYNFTWKVYQPQWRHFVTDVTAAKSISGQCHCYLRILLFRLYCLSVNGYIHIPRRLYNQKLHCQRTWQ